MKKMKKVITAVTMLICMGLFMFVSANSTFAADSGYEVTVNLDKTQVNAGDTVTATLNLTKNAGIAGLTMHVSYDTGVLEFVSADAVKDILAGPSVKKDTDGTGVVGYSYASEENATGTGSILTITFKVKDTAKVGESQIGFAKLDGATSTSETTVSKIDISAGTATFTVNCNHADTTTNTTKEATCTENGTSEVVCNTCGAVVKTDNIPALGHTFGEYSVTKEATCTDKGTEEATCSRCGAKDQKEIAAMGHKFGEYTVTKNPTCTEKGSKEATCSVCGAKDIKETDATGHTYGSYKITKEATEKAEGEIKRKCSVCGDEVVTVIPKLSSKNFAITETDGKAIAEKYAVNTTFEFKAPVYKLVGSGDNLGDIRYVPVSYKVNGNEYKFDGSSYTAKVSLEKKGTYSVEVKYACQIKDAEGWVADGNTYTYSTEFEVVKKEEVPTTKKNTTDTTKSEEETKAGGETVTTEKVTKLEKTDSKQVTTAGKVSDSSKSSNPKTGDTTVKVVVGFVTLIIVAGAVVLVVIKKKKFAKQ